MAHRASSNPSSRSPMKSAKRILTYEDFEFELQENSALWNNFKYLPKAIPSNALTVETFPTKHNPHGFSHLILKRLHIGTRSRDPGTSPMTVCAYYQGHPELHGTTDGIIFYGFNKDTFEKVDIHSQEVKLHWVFDAQLKSGGHDMGLVRMRLLILFYLLEKGVLRRLSVDVGSLDIFRRACRFVAKKAMSSGKALQRSDRPSCIVRTSTEQNIHTSGRSTPATIRTPSTTTESNEPGQSTRTVTETERPYQRESPLGTPEHSSHTNQSRNAEPSRDDKGMQNALSSKPKGLGAPERPSHGRVNRPSKSQIAISSPTQKLSSMLKMKSEMPETRSSTSSTGALKRSAADISDGSDFRVSPKQPRTEDKVHAKSSPHSAAEPPIIDEGFHRMQQLYEHIRKEVCADVEQLKAKFASLESTNVELQKSKDQADANAIEMRRERDNWLNRCTQTNMENFVLKCDKAALVSAKRDAEVKAAETISGLEIKVKELEAFKNGIMGYTSQFQFPAS